MSVERIISKDLLVIPQGNGGVLLKFKDSPPTDSISVTSAEVASLVASETADLVAADAALSAAINVVSNAVSNEVSTREATSAALETHIETVSIAVASINSFLSGVSARSVGGVSTHGIQSVIDALSNRISAGGGTGSVTSQELSVVAAGLSGRIDTASALASTADVHASVASAAATSADAHANTVSVAVVDEASIRSVAINLVSNAASNALSVANAASAGVNVVSNALSVEIADRISANNVLSTAINVVSNALSTEALALSGRVNSVNTALSAVSARSVGNVSTHGLQSVIDALSNRISASGGTASVTSQELSVVAAALSGRIDTASALASVADLHASTASVAATSVDSRVNSVNSFISGISARSVGDVSTHGLQSVVDALSNNISIASAAATSVDARVNTVSNLVSQNIVSIAAISNLLSGVSARSVGVSVKGIQSALNALSGTISQLIIDTADGLSVLSSYINTVSVKVSALSRQVSVNSVGMTSVDSRVNSVNTFISDISARSLGNVSTHGLQSVINALSNRISAGGTASVTSQELSVTIAALSSRIDTASALASTADAHASIASAAATSADTHANTASTAATSVDGRVNSVNTFLSGISARSVGGVSTHGIQSVINALSNRISAIPGGGSANPYSYVSAGQAICANAFTDISGLCVSVSAGGIYKLEGQVMFSCSAATGNSFTLVFPTMSVAAGQLRAPFLNPVPGTSVGYSAITWGNFGTAGSGSALISANFAAGALFDLIIDGVMNVNTTGVIKVQARGSVATNTITITPGSYLKVFKIR